ncbi:solute carrier family 2, facilitated glucose transporter member 1 isoform X1 [Parasteatoda tepidariorum]|uniref:solute carrier family 2, facilitated glucose transporter member 1 isoform X1 n=1 Tax=Parasteatoda tepidariorum TaxID=114398 RepID=UPI001C71F176|nr:solute carrier family 2, facilitated glucose transporter member 1 isoform X1 [Parasteatoda tepidariorum]
MKIHPLKETSKLIEENSFFEGLTGHLVFAIAAAALGSSFQHGYNTGVVNAPQTLIQKFINQTYYEKHNEVPSESTVVLIFSIMVSIFCLGGMVGALGTAYLAEKFGRKGGLLMNNVFVFVAAALCGFCKLANSYEMMIIGRFVIGLNSGLSAGLAPMYLTEISPIHLRGAVGTIYQLIITTTILISQILGLPELLGTEERWPYLFGLIIIPAIFMLITLPLCPESPKFILINKGKDVAAQKALTWLRGTNDVHYEMDEMRAEFEEMKLVPKVTLKEMYTNPILRKPLIIAVVVMLSQQLSGINAVIFYSTEIFRNAGLTTQAAINATLGMGSVNVVMTLVSMILVERAGRKTLHLTGLAGMMIITLLLTISLALTPRAAWLSYVSVICIIGFIVMFACGPGSIPWFLVAEIFGQGARPLATSIAVSVNWMANFIVGLGFLPIVSSIGEYTFLIFSALLAMFWLFTYNQVPETKGRTVEEITAEFRQKANS